MQIEKRDLVTAIILSIVTCGIYGLYWYYCILKDLYRVTNQPDSANTDLLLSIVTCGIYGIYVFYKIGQMETQACQTYRLYPVDNAVLYLILCLFNLSIVSMVMVQDNLNKNIGPAFDYVQYNNTNTGYQQPPVYPNQPTGEQPTNPNDTNTTL